MGENIKINCPSCGGSVSQEDAQDGICTCPFCKNTFYVKDIINQPKVTVNNTYITNNYTTEKDNIASYAKDVATSYADAFRDTAKVVFSPRVIIAQVIMFIIAILAIIGGFFAYNYFMDKPLRDAVIISDEWDGDKTTGSVDISKRIYVVLADDISVKNKEASIAYYWYNDDDEFKDVKLHAEPSTGLSNGDDVKITISDKGSHENVTFEPSEWHYTVDLMLMDDMN